MGKEIRICNSGYSGNPVIVPLMPQLLSNAQLVSHLLRLSFSIFGAAFHFQHPRISCYLSQTGKCILMLKMYIFYPSQNYWDLKWELQQRTMLDTKNCALEMEFQALGDFSFRRRGRSLRSCQIIQLVLLTHKVGQGHSLLALERSPVWRWQWK